MRRARITAVSSLAVLTVVMAGCTDGGEVLDPSARTAGATAVNDASAAMRELDALTRSRAVDPAQAQAINQEPADELTGDIDFSQASGLFTGELSVSLSTAIAGAEIRYTTDGTVPTAASTLYSEPVVLAATTQLRAQAFVDGEASGALGTSVYVARDAAVTTEHDVPVVVLDAYGAGKPGREYVDVAAMVIEPQAGSATLSQTPSVATRAGFHLRGQSSASFEKAPYRLELWDNADDDADYSVAGMPADSDWVLRGPWPDKTLIRDAFAYTLGRDMGLRAPRFSFAEVYINLDDDPLTAADYQGVYMLQENLKISEDRVNIAELEETDNAEPNISGGYLLQFNALAAEQPVVQCTPPVQEEEEAQPAQPGFPGQQNNGCFRDLEIVEPKDLTTQQRTWLTNYIQQFHNSLRSENPSDPDTGYPAYIDVDSFVDRIIHNELALEGDSYIRSTHFFKDRGGKLTAGPLWDYDLGYASFPGFAGGGPGGPGGGGQQPEFEPTPPATVSGWQFQAGFAFGTSDWFTRLMADPAFLERVRTRWAELRTGVMSAAQLQARVDTLSAALVNAAERNFTKWPILEQNNSGFFPTVRTQTWQEQLDYLKDFLVRRSAWLDDSGWEIPAATTPGVPGGGGPPPPPPDDNAPPARDWQHPLLLNR